MKTSLIAAAIIALAVPVVASEGDDPTSLSYISYLERYATIQPSTQQESVEAVINMPLVAGDRIDTARQTRMEVVLADGNILWLDEYTTLSLDSVAFSRDNTADRSVLYLAEGTLMVEISEHRLSGTALRVDGRSATVYLSDTGLYRVVALPSGGLRLEVWQGLAEASTVAGGVLVQPESSVEVRDGEIIGTEPYLTWSDEFATWVDQRRQILRGESSQYVDARFDRQAAQLDNYGNWVYVQEYNTWAWQPTVSSGWRPYTAGRWYWTPTGWSWVSYEPWGWLPYHYGSWYFSVGFGWVWGWGNCWGPAWVNWWWGPGWVGWCPSGYYWGWYWPRYCSFYGYPSWPSRPGYPGYPGGGGGQPPRRDVIPRPGAGGGGANNGAVRRSELPRPDNTALDLKGRARVADADRSAWNVVSDRDFASPNLARLVRPGDEALRGRDDVGIVSSDPLVTAPPSRAQPARELERTFRRIEQGTDRDLTPIMARDDSLRPEDALRLVRPTTTSDISRRTAAAARSVDPSTSTWGVPGSGRQEPTLTNRSGSPLHASEDRSTTNSQRSIPDRSSTGSRTQSADARNPFVPRTRPTTAVAPRSVPDAGAASRVGPRVPTTSGSGSVSRQPATRNEPSTGTTSRRVPTTSSGTRTTRPVVVPRTAPSTRRPTTGSTRPSSRNPTASRSRSGSSNRSSAASAPSRSYGGRSSSAGRPSGGSSAPRSAPSAAPRSSGGSRRH